MTKPAMESPVGPNAPNDDDVTRWVVAATDGISEGLIVFNRDGLTVYRNAAAGRMVGTCETSFDDGGFVETLPFGLFEDDEHTPIKPSEHPVMRALVDGLPTRDASYFLRNTHVPQGIHFVASITPLYDDAGSRIGAACTLRELTRLRAQEAQLRESVRQKQAILDNIPDIAWLKDEHGRFLLVNAQLAEAAGRPSPDAMVGLTDRDVWPEELADRYRADDAEVMRTRVHKRLEEPFVASDGTRSWLETFKTCIVDDHGRVIGTTGIARDITERKRFEEDLRSTKADLERRVRERTLELAEAQEHLVRQERLAVLGQLAGGVAHQIRNPLAAMLNASYVLKRHLTEGEHPHVVEAIGIIRDEIQHANVIITSLLDYASVRTPDRCPTSVVDILRRILGSEWIPGFIDVRADMPARGSVVVDIDPHQIHDAITNIVRNAVDAMPQGGDLHVSLAESDNLITLSIADTGPGISPQVKGHLFEPLQTTKPMGVGLGLVTARRFVEAHGGRIACVEVPRGARFDINLPKSLPDLEQVMILP